VLTLDQLNAADCSAFTALLEGTYEHSPWVAEAAYAEHPFRSLVHLKQALVRAVRHADHDTQLQLVRAHPELAGKAAMAGDMTAESVGEQGRAGLNACTPAQFAKLQQLNADYNERFGWPFIMAVRGPRGTGLTREQIIATFERRLASHPDIEFAEALRNIHRIAEIRLNEKFGHEPVLGRQVWDCAELLAQHSDSADDLTVTYMTPAHQACQRQLLHWMHDCGFDDATVDAVGNVVGVYHGTDRNLPRLMTGSHYDTVRNAGWFDGRVGIFVPLVVVRELQRAGRRLPFGIELVAFAEEEGQRYKATLLGSSAVIGRFDGDWLDQHDGDGITMREAMQSAGFSADAAEISMQGRDPKDYLGFVEVHIEQGPVLTEMDLPLGVVNSIYGSARYTGELIGQASHAGTTPMDRRRDAATAAAELALYVERRASSEPELVGTMGVLEVPRGSVNVVPGRCRFTLDLRGPTNEVRDELVADVLEELDRIVNDRGLQLTLEESHRASAAPSDADLQARWSEAVESLGLHPHALPSGAGHDAMKLHEVMPQAMLFVRGENLGISHNPLESSTDDDLDLAVRGRPRPQRTLIPARP